MDTDHLNPAYETWYKTFSVYDERYFNYYLNTNLLSRKTVRTLDGNIYLHAPYSKRKDFKIYMIDKSKPYKVSSSDTVEIPLDDMMRHSLVITISEDRHNLFCKVFKAHGLEPLPEKIQGVCDKQKTPAENCRDSHILATKIAKERNWPYVCIFEDDAYPATGIRKKLENYLSCIPNTCHILILGNSFAMSCSPFNNRFFSNFKGWGSHAYIVFRDYYDKHIQFLEKAKATDYWGIKSQTDVDFSRIFAPRKNLFIQFTRKREGIHSLSGYILLNSLGKCINPNEILSQGFPRIETIVPDVFYRIPPSDNSRFMFG